MNAHTPGPWTMVRGDQWPWATSIRAGNVWISEISRYVASNDKTVADADARPYNVTAQANAHLIAAAPELLDAVRIGHASLCGCTTGNHCGAPTLFAALAKATASDLLPRAEAAPEGSATS